VENLLVGVCNRSSRVGMLVLLSELGVGVVGLGGGTTVT